MVTIIAGLPVGGTVLLAVVTLVCVVRRRRRRAPADDPVMIPLNVVANPVYNGFDNVNL